MAATKASETAVVLIEFQNEFCSPSGALYGAVKDELKRNRTLENTKELLEKVRGKCLIVHVPIAFDPDYKELKKPYGILKAVVEGKAFRKGTRGAEIYRPLAARKGDIVVEGKRSLCGFGSTNLDFILRARGIKRVALAGFLTNVCVESTARTAYDRGYEVITLVDCMAAASEEEQKFAEEKIFPLISRPMTHTQFIRELAGKKARTAQRGYDR